ncbi:MAG: DNA topoisomerase IV subunit A [Lentisphaeria bacterium]|nr:DNA topoisomerase IV subunit A [Lentisphaeria bacterium]
MTSTPDNTNLPIPVDEEQHASPPDVSSEDTLQALVSKHFIEYASYVIKERAIPDVDDGLKPVQRRILHAMSTIDDGRFNKVANVVGNTMQYHPHGDASITDALVVVANKKYFIEGQGNFGNILTGDPASAARYIECRLTPLAKEVLFNKDITLYTDSYDGRNKEPVCLPCKVPSLLMLGSDGIAVGMRTQIFPHNFKELLNAQIAILEQRPFQIYPDFPQGGIMDVSEYDDGAGKIRLRARIEAEGEKKLVIREIPATTTTESLIESISRAVRRGKLKITSINDYTAENVEVEINLARGVYAEEAIKELYAYTDCELTIRSTLLVIRENVPVEMTVSEVLQRNTEKLLDILRRELELELQREEDRFHDRSLVRIFIENRIYKRIEKCESLEKILSETRKGLEAFRHLLHRDISDEDIEKLLQIHIRRISLFDLNRMTEELDAILDQMEKTKFNLAHLTDYTIQTLRDLLEKYAPLYPRLTRIEGFETVNVREIARADLKVWHDKLNFFVGTHVKGSNKNDEPLICTEYDRLMLLKNDGTCKVIAVPEKEYIGATKYLFLADKEQVYSIIYRDRQEGTWYAKRFQLGQYILSKEYHIIPPNCLIEHLYTNSAVVVRLELAANNRRSYNSITVDFDSYPMRSREARGFKLTHYPVTAVAVITRGSSTTEATDNQEITEKEQATPAEPSTDQPAPENQIIADSTEQDHEEEVNSIPPAKEEHSSIIKTEISVPVQQSQSTAESSPKRNAKRSGTKKTSGKKIPDPHPSEGKPGSAPIAAAVQAVSVDEPSATSSVVEPIPASAAGKPVKSPSIAAPAISAPASTKPALAPPLPEQKPVPPPVQPAPATDEKKPKALKKLIDEDTPFFLE